MSVQSYARKSGTELSKDFNSDEFDCHCGKCEFTLIDDLLVSRLQLIRDKTGRPIKIHSGYRCEVRQKQIKDMGFKTAEGPSTHEKGMAADFLDGMSGLEIEKVARECGFTSVGVAANWIHADTREGFRRWAYP